MNKYKIDYQIKNTKSNNTYIEISTKDEAVLLKCVLSLNSYMQELCLSNDPDVKLVREWYRSPDKSYPFNKRLGKRNTPETMIAGLINNMIFGHQENLSLEQLPFYEDIINKSTEIIEELELAKKFTLQTNNKLTGIVFGIGI